MKSKLHNGSTNRLDFLVNMFALQYKLMLKLENLEMFNVHL
jgi:hypothetical protein